MKWGARALTGIVRAAGFPADLEAEAVALALATSGGDDCYHYRPGMPGSGDLRGLWGVDVDRWPWCATHDLWTATGNAAAALDLTRAAGHFGWSPVAHTGFHRQALEHAATARTYPDLHQRAGVEWGIDERYRRLDAAMDAMRGRRA